MGRVELTVKEIYNIEEKNLPLKELVNHPAFSHVFDETNFLTGAVCSIYFRCPTHPAGYMFVGVGKIKDLPPHIKVSPDPHYENIGI